MLDGRGGSHYGAPPISGQYYVHDNVLSILPFIREGEAVSRPKIEKRRERNPRTYRLRRQQVMHLSHFAPTLLYILFIPAQKKELLAFPPKRRL